MITLRTLPVPLVGAALLTLAACAPTESEPTASDSPMSASADAAQSHSADAMAEDSMTDDAAATEPAVSVPEQLQFTATVVGDGTEFDGASLAGQDSLVWVWASWCPTCQAEASEVAEAAERLPEGVALYGLPGKSAMADAEDFIAEYGLESFPHLFDEDGTLWSNFGVSYQPALIMIDDDGTVTVMAGATDADGIVAAGEELAAS